MEKYTKLKNPIESSSVQIKQQLDDDEFLKQTLATRKAFNNRLFEKPINKFLPTTKSEKTFVKINNNKLVSISSVPKDPLEPSKFKHRKMQIDANEDEKVPILSSPTKKLTTEELKNFQIPPCISNWKNKHSYTIPLHMRMLADLRGNRNTKINENFTEFNDVLNLTEKEMIKNMEERNKVKDTMKMVETIRKEQELLKTAEEAKKLRLMMLNSSDGSFLRDTSEFSDLGSIVNTSIKGTESITGNPDKKRKNSNFSSLSNIKTLNTTSNSINFNANLTQNENKLLDQRNKIRTLLGQKKNINRDFNENVALGNNINIPTSDPLINPKLYNKTSGLDSGFRFDDEYDYCDKPLFNEKKGVFSFEKNFTETKDPHKLLEKLKQSKGKFEGAHDERTTHKIEFTKK